MVGRLEAEHVETKAELEEPGEAPWEMAMEGLDRGLDRERGRAQGERRHSAQGDREEGGRSKGASRASDLRKIQRAAQAPAAGYIREARLKGGKAGASQGWSSRRRGRSHEEGHGERRSRLPELHAEVEQGHPLGKKLRV
jgi:hypothetical protein